MITGYLGDYAEYNDLQTLQKARVYTKSSVRAFIAFFWREHSSKAEEMRQNMKEPEATQKKCDARSISRTC